uniref:Uncharacterized protein n=1 Tax=Ralstonia solanacearum TaxID=305 RepID=A0A0S4WRG1_RALSL|nr:protein of unknown function [Ralstonia solanacearum]
MELSTPILNMAEMTSKVPSLNLLQTIMLTMVAVLFKLPQTLDRSLWNAI